VSSRGDVFESLRRDGWTLVPGVLDAAFRQQLITELERVYVAQRELQIANGIGDGTDGTVHHLPLAGGAFLELLERNPLAGLLDQFFGGPYIVNTYGGVLNLPGNLSYVGRIHRDLSALFAALFTVSNPIPVKWAMNEFGFRAGTCRPPLGPMPADLKLTLGPLIAPFRRRNR